MDRISPIRKATQGRRPKRRMPDQKGVQDIRDLPDPKFPGPWEIQPTGRPHSRRTDAVWPRQMERLD
jgi:hypothetical protein